MDRTLNNSLLSKGSPYSPRVRQNISSKKALQSSFRKSSRFSVSGKSTQSMQIILSTPYNYVERFGQPLPVLITEALTFAERNVVVSAKISNYGYAWVVCGRRLLIWQYRQGMVKNQKKSMINQCFELQLPQSDLAHRAELVSVFIDNKTNIPSCIAISPEGVVRYWPAIIHEGVSVEQCIDLQGQECDSLTDVEDLGCILATTTCTIVLIQPQLISGRPSLKCKQLKTPTGWLGGISKRMSSLIFGPITGDHSNETRLVRVVSNKTSESTWIVYVLAGHSLQKWKLTLNETEELIFVSELNRIVRDSFRNALWENCIGDQTEIDIWLLDIQIDKDNIIILAAAVNIPVSPRLHYAMICIETSQTSSPTNIKDFLLLKITDLYREDENSTDSLNYKFLLCGTIAYLYNQKNIIVIKPQEDPDKLDFNLSNDYLLNGTICVNTPIFFLKNNGLISISSNEMSIDYFNTSNITNQNNISINNIDDNNIILNNLSIYNMDPEKITNTYNDKLGQLKSAFIYYIKKQQNYNDIILNIFPLEQYNIPGIDSIIDKIVVMMCTDLLDDIPAGDPRWNKDNIPLGIGSSYTMQILYQLEDKQKVHKLFINFLKDSGIWNRLGAITIRNNILATIYYLEELSEKIIAAITLKSINNNEILDKAIDNTIKQYDNNELQLYYENGLTNQDLFYRQVSKIHKGIQEIVNYCEDISHSNMDPIKIVEIIRDSNDIILSVLKNILKHRQENIKNYLISDNVKKIAPDYILWTNCGGSDGLADSLLQLKYLTYNYGVMLTTTSNNNNNNQYKYILLDYLVNIIDIILDGKKCHLDSLKGTSREKIIYKQYCIDRENLMKPLIKEKEYERALKLAEKYLDFESLIIICESTNNQDRLDEYIDRFNEQGFSDFLYNWFLKENKQSKLINKYKTGKTKNKQQLSNFLIMHPSISWMQYIYEKKFDLAADTLKKLAINETESISRQKVMFSLCKLAKLAAPNNTNTISNNNDDKFLNDINLQLELISFQEEIPDYILQYYGYDIKNLRVIPPKDLINLYICSEYKEATELEFKKALDLLFYIKDDELKEKLSLKIWRSAITKDTWHHTNLDSPLDIIQNKLFFKLIDLCIALNGDESLNLLPPLDILIEDDEQLKEFQNDKNFQYLLKTGYEQICRTQMLN